MKYVINTYIGIYQNSIYSSDMLGFILLDISCECLVHTNDKIVIIIITKDCKTFK